MMTFQQKEGVTILNLTGKLIGEAIPELREILTRSIDKSKSPRILINLGRVRGMDSAGLGTLLAAYSATQQKNGRIGIINAGNHIRNLIVFTRLVNVFERFENEDTAIAAFSNW